MENPFRHLPSVNDLLETPVLKKVVNKVSHNVVVDNVRNFLDDMRTKIKDKTDNFNVPTPNEMAQSIASWISSDDQPSLLPVINGTGVILHTGLGRAPLAAEAIEAISAISTGYASVEVSLKTGNRSQRVNAVDKLLCELTGAEAAVVTNNNAGATLLTLAAIAHGQETIVSRGELVEIGGSFRLPDVMSASGSVLKEVGTTNKTRAADYSSAINEQTGALMKVHTSNYAITGFTESTPIEELVAIGKKQRLPVIDDVGSGALVDFSKYGMADEPQIQKSIQAGADLVLFSGDKLLGGPQCGIIVGKQKWINQIANHPMMRAFRVDKMTLAGLAATLRLYRNLEDAEAKIPVLSMLSASTENLANRSSRLLPRLQNLGVFEDVQIVDTEAKLGGGSLPNQSIPSKAVQVQTKVATDRFAEKLRTLEIPVFGRVHKDHLYFDLRTILPSQDLKLVELFQSIQ